MRKNSNLLILIFFIGISYSSFGQESHSSCASKVTDKEWYSSGKKAPLFTGLDGINFPITTKNPEAQKYFNQGLMLSYAFNHAEAARSFYEAIRLDSSCAMCYWGYALVLGPNYNAGMERDNILRAYEASLKALDLSGGVTQKESMLISALTRRYDSVVTEDRSWNDEMYAFSMGSLYSAFPDDADVGSLYAEALMNQHPWDLWNADGTAKSWTPEIIKVLESTLKKFPRHAGANHYYIHAVEASPKPERAMASADLLRDLVPGAGHLVHMPSHIYIRTGRYYEGTLANKKAIEVDEDYISSCHAQGVYPLAYFPHNYHFMAATAALGGDKATAVMSSKKMREQLDTKLLRDPEWGTLQHYYSIIYYVMVKFGMWDEILNESISEKDLPYPQAVLEYAKGMASIAKQNPEAAESHLKELERLAMDSAVQSVTIWELNSASDLLKIAINVLKGELFNYQKMSAESIDHLKQAIEIEDKLNYNEPPDWFFSVRHNLGAVALQNKDYKTAEQAYREDLKKYPANGWALKGLKQSLSGQGRIEEAIVVEREFKEAWKHSDVEIHSSRIF